MGPNTLIEKGDNHLLRAEWSLAEIAYTSAAEIVAGDERLAKKLLRLEEIKTAAFSPSEGEYLKRYLLHLGEDPTPIARFERFMFVREDEKAMAVADQFPGEIAKDPDAFETYITHLQAADEYAGVDRLCSEFGSQRSLSRWTMSAWLTALWRIGPVEKRYGVLINYARNCSEAGDDEVYEELAWADDEFRQDGAAILKLARAFFAGRPDAARFRAISDFLSCLLRRDPAGTLPGLGDFCRRLLDTYPGDPRILCEAARLFRARGDNTRADDYGWRAVRFVQTAWHDFDDEIGRVSLDLAREVARLGDRGLALQLLKRRMKVTDCPEEDARQCGALCEEMDLREDAIRFYSEDGSSASQDRVVELSAQCDGFLDYADKLSAIGNEAEAIDALRERGEHDGRYLRRLILLLADTGRLDEALSQARKAQNEAPNDERLKELMAYVEAKIAALRILPVERKPLVSAGNGVPGRI